RFSSTGQAGDDAAILLHELDSVTVLCAGGQEAALPGGLSTQADVHHACMLGERGGQRRLWRRPRSRSRSGSAWNRVPPVPAHRLRPSSGSAAACVGQNAYGREADGGVSWSKKDGGGE